MHTEHDPTVTNTFTLKFTLGLYSVIECDTLHCISQHYRALQGSALKFSVVQLSAW